MLLYLCCSVYDKKFANKNAWSQPAEMLHVLKKVSGKYSDSYHQWKYFNSFAFDPTPEDYSYKITWWSVSYFLQSTLMTGNKSEIIVSCINIYIAFHWSMTIKVLHYCKILCACVHVCVYVVCMHVHWCVLSIRFFLSIWRSQHIGICKLAARWSTLNIISRRQEE